MYERALTIVSSAKCGSVRQSRELFCACLGGNSLRMPRERADVGRTALQQPLVYALLAAALRTGMDADGGFATRNVRDLIRLRLAGTVIREIAGRVSGGPAVASYFATSIRFSPKLIKSTRPEAKPIAPRGIFFSSCRAVHQQLSAVAQSYPHVQRFLAEGSDRALSELRYFDYRRSRL